MPNTKFKNRSDFYASMKLTSLNDDPIGVLSNVYDEYPHPVFDPEKICFRRYRNYDHRKFNDRVSIKENVHTVFEDFEMYLPGEGDKWHGLTEKNGNSPITNNDYVITSCITTRDHLWPVPYVYNNYHFVQTHHANLDIQIAYPPERPFFADVLLGNSKPHRLAFFEMMKANNMLGNNIVNLFNVYRSDFLDTVKDDMQAMIYDNPNKTYPNTTLLLNGQFISQYISVPIMENSWISVVAETIDDNDIFFVTEKTAKPLMAGKPFIMLGGVNYLKHLRNLGFETFAPVIDESYDDVVDYHQRVKMAFRSFKALSEQDPKEIMAKLSPILQHNRNIMYDKKKLTQRARFFLDDLHAKYKYDTKSKH